MTHILQQLNDMERKGEGIVREIKRNLRDFNQI